MIFRQLFDPDSSTYTYLIGSTGTTEAVLIDPVDGHLEDYLELLRQLGLRLKYSIETHVHADLITASGRLRQRIGAETAVSRLCGAMGADHQLTGGDVLGFAAGEEINVLSTPGHTPGSSSFLWRDRLFTGDTLLINGCGRTDFQGGDPGGAVRQHHRASVPAARRDPGLPGPRLPRPSGELHRPGTRHQSTPRGKTREQFIEIMHRLDLPKPLRIDEAVPRNRLCGLHEEEVRQG